MTQERRSLESTTTAKWKKSTKPIPNAILQQPASDPSSSSVMETCRFGYSSDLHLQLHMMWMDPVQAEFVDMWANGSYTTVEAP